MKIELTKAGSGAASLAAILGGALDIGVTATLTVVLGYARAVPFTFLAPSGLWLPASEGRLLVAASSPLRVAKDFVGKIVSIAAIHDIGDLAMRIWMDQNGADSEAVKFVEIPQSAAQAALEQGRVDAITLTNPAFVLAVSGGKARFVANIYSAISPRYLLGGWVTTTAWVEKNHSAAERFSRVIAEASAYVNGHPQETLGDVIDFTGIERSLATRMKRTLFTSALSAADIQPVINAAAKYKVLEKTYPATELISSAAVR